MPDELVAPPPGGIQAIRGTESLFEWIGVAGFARVLVPIHLDDQSDLVIGSWLRLDIADLPTIQAAWNSDAYSGLRLTGRLANVIEPWGDQLLAASVEAVAVEPTQVPYLIGGQDPLIDRVLNHTWHAGQILPAFASAL